MKIFHLFSLALVAACCVAADPTWNPDNAVKEAEQDIRSGHTNDIPLRERQEEYARRYNEKMFAYVSQKY